MTVGLLLELVARLALVVGGAVLVVTPVVVGLDRLATLRRRAIPRLREVGPYVAVLLVVLAVSAVGRQGLQNLSQLYGLYLTGYIFAFEGEFVAWVQSFATPGRTLFFSWVYVYGYTFLLVFPLVAYAAMDRPVTLKRFLAAYSLNYALGLVCYTLVFAHGPRNVMPDMVTSLLYTTTPAYQELTSQVNENSNVFPSLHTSLSLTVAAFAVRTRDEYPLWPVVAVPLALAVVVATMYLGIHWATDVLGGAVLAAFSVWVAVRYVE